MRFAEKIGCTIDPKAKYPLTKAGFLTKLAEWTRKLQEENERRMNDPRAGRRV